MKKILNACMMIAVVLVWTSCESPEEPKDEASEAPVEQVPAPIDTNQMNKVDTNKVDTGSSQRPDNKRT